jgi:hypothetical protein
MDNVQKHNICTNVPSSQTLDLINFVEVILEKPPVSQPLKNIPIFYGR